MEDGSDARRLCIRCDAELRVTEFDHAGIPFCRGCLAGRRLDAPTAKPTEGWRDYVALLFLGLMGLTGLLLIGVMLMDGPGSVAPMPAVLGVAVLSGLIGVGYTLFVVSLALRGLHAPPRASTGKTRQALIARLDLIDAVGHADIPSVLVSLESHETRCRRRLPRPIAHGLLFRTPGGLVFLGEKHALALPWERIRACELTPRGRRQPPAIELVTDDDAPGPLLIGLLEGDGAAERLADDVRIQVLANDLTA